VLGSRAWLGLPLCFSLCYCQLSLNRLGRLIKVYLNELSSLLFQLLVVRLARLSSSLAAALLYSAFLLMKYMPKHVLKKVCDKMCGYNKVAFRKDLTLGQSTTTDIWPKKIIKSTATVMVILN
jgi:hypothetical protein